MFSATVFLLAGTPEFQPTTPFVEEISVAKGDYLFTSESVSEGHPDKICDRISDEIVDLFMTSGADARTGVETLVTTNQVVLAGEVRGPESIDHEKMEELARKAVREIGYEQDNFHWSDMDVRCLVHSQSPDIAQGVDAAGNKDEGAGDQGLMFGYACRETAELMPAPIQFSHAILRHMAEARHAGKLPGIGPDSKSQVTLVYEGGKPVRAASVVVSTQHDDSLEQDQVRELVRPFVLDVLPEGWMCDEDHFYVNPTGRFVIGGPDSDAGLTGRKIIVDTYGGAAPHGGGAFSGKDPARWTARPLMVPVMSPRTWSPPVSPSAVSFRSPMQLAYPSRCRSMSRLTAPVRRQTAS